jgi:hypothetical protein
MWREDRWLTLSLLAFLGGLTCMAGLSTYWGDEVWGPRYIVPAAWALLVPIAWWVDRPRRRRALAWVAGVAIFVQVIGVSAAYSRYTHAVRGLTGVPIYLDRYGVPNERIPYGDDPTRWIPQLSALLVQTEGLISSQVIDRLGGDGLNVTYAPFEGRSRTINLSDPRYRMQPDFWWDRPPSYRWAARVLALAMLAIAVYAAVLLYRVSYRRPGTAGAAGAGSPA